MPCLGAYVPGGTRTTNPLITSQECEPLHHGTLTDAFLVSLEWLLYTGLTVLYIMIFLNPVTGFFFYLQHFRKLCLYIFHFRPCTNVIKTEIIDTKVYLYPKLFQYVKETHFSSPLHQHYEVKVQFINSKIKHSKFTTMKHLRGAYPNSSINPETVSFIPSNQKRCDVSFLRFS